VNVRTVEASDDGDNDECVDVQAESCDHRHLAVAQSVNLSADLGRLRPAILGRVRCR